MSFLFSASSLAFLVTMASLLSKRYWALTWSCLAYILSLALFSWFLTFFSRIDRPFLFNEVWFRCNSGLYFDLPIRASCTYFVFNAMILYGRFKFSWLWECPRKGPAFSLLIYIRPNSSRVRSLNGVFLSRYYLMMLLASTYCISLSTIFILPTSLEHSIGSYQKTPFEALY